MATVTKGPEAVAAKLDALAAEGKGAAIADAIFDRDLETLAAPSWRGDSRSAPRASAWPRPRPGGGWGGTRDAAGAAVGEPVGGHAACLAGSCSQATLGQVAAAEARMPVLRLDAGRLLSESEAVVAEALAFARERIARGRC